MCVGGTLYQLGYRPCRDDVALHSNQEGSEHVHHPHSFAHKNHINVNKNNNTSVITKTYSSLAWGVASLSEGKSRGSVFSVAVCKIQVNKCYVEPLQ